MTVKNKKDWIIWGEWDNIPWFHSCYLAGLGIDLKKYSGQELKYLAADFDGKKQRIFCLNSEWQKVGIQFFKQIKKSPENLKRILNQIEKATKNLIKINSQIQKQHPNKIDTKLFIALYKKFHAAKHLLWSIGMTPNLLELNNGLLSEHLRQTFILKGKITNQEWVDLIMPTTPSAIQNETNDFFNLYLKIKASKKALSHFSTEIKNHAKKYCWVEYGWMGTPLDVDYFSKKMNLFLKDKKLVDQTQKNIKHFRNLKSYQAIIEQRLNLTPKEKTLLSLLRKILETKTQRVDALYEAYYSIHPFLINFAKKNFVTTEEIYSLHGKEIINFVKTGKLPKAKQKTADIYSLYLKERSKLNFYSGTSARKKIRPIIASIIPTKSSSIITGQTAFPGIVSGKVKIVNSRQEINKINKGDIMISYVTDPSLLPAMKKAAAFVTNMGGLTCHAAIVAREMRKPCIVGTKNATSSFKDGDFVEVNATNGLVKKIKRVKND